MYTSKRLTQIYCSMSCRSKRADVMLPPKRCTGCGGMFIPPITSNRVFCDRKCATNARAIKLTKLVPIQCLQCDKTFQPEIYTRKYCGPKCFYNSRRINADTGTTTTTENESKDGNSNENENVDKSDNNSCNSGWSMIVHFSDSSK